MKTRLSSLIALAAVGVSLTAFAQFPIDIPSPAVELSGSAPRLFPSEQGAFKALELATQIIESKIAHKGCQNGRWDFEVHTIYDGSGTAVLSNRWDQVIFTVAIGEYGYNEGRWYTVTGGGNLGRLTFTDINGQGSFNIGSSIQEFSSSWKTTSLLAFKPNEFKSTLIKDYLRLNELQPIPEGFDDAGTPVSTVIDYGYQQISKNNYVQAKYWQQSRTWRDDGVNAGTYWLNTRVAPANQPCVIEVKLAGYGEYPADNLEGFNEKGTVAVKTVEIGAYLQIVESK
ncbi:MAG: hypothetical protein ACXWTS_06400 [Methylococcaceae bacterium]